MNDTSIDLLTAIAQAIYDKKGFNILVLDARHISTLTDYFIIAEGRSDRHVRSLCDAVLASLAPLKMAPYAIEGKAYGEWVAVDYLDMIVHLFGPNMRERYSLEELWRECKIVDVPIVVRADLRESDWE